MASQVDDFESGVVSDDYNGDTGSFAFVAGTETGSGSAQSGSQVLEYTAADSSFYDLRGGSGAAFDTGLNDTPEADDTFEFYLQTGQNGGEGVVCWFIQEDAWVADGGYCIRFDWSGPTVKLQKLPTGGTNFSDLATFNTPGRPKNSWYRYEVTHKSDGSITATIYDSDGNQQDQVTATDSDWSSGGVAYEMLQNNDNLWLDNYVITQEAGAAGSVWSTTTGVVQTSSGSITTE